MASCYAVAQRAARSTAGRDRSLGSRIAAAAGAMEGSGGGSCDCFEGAAHRKRCGLRSRLCSWLRSSSGAGGRRAPSTGPKRRLKLRILVGLRFDDMFENRGTTIEKQHTTRHSLPCLRVSEICPVNEYSFDSPHHNPRGVSGRELNAEPEKTVKSKSSSRTRRSTTWLAYFRRSGPPLT